MVKVIPGTTDWHPKSRVGNHTEDNVKHNLHKSGFTLGVFATKTNVSKEVFGEGSFDKGFYFSIPTNLFYSDYRSGNISFGLHPLTKDAGSFLVVHNSLFSIFGDSNRKNIFDDIDDLTR